MNGLQTALQNILMAPEVETRAALLAILLRELWAAQLAERADYWAQDCRAALAAATTVAELAARLRPLLESPVLIRPDWPVAAEEEPGA